MPDFIIEILSEEIPARMQAQAANNFKKLVLSELAGQKLQFSSVRSYVTPRRLAVLVTGVPKKQPTNNEERRGPRADAPAKAINGFKSSVPKGAVIEEKKTPKGIFLFATVELGGEATSLVLEKIVANAVSKLPWPKSMRIGHESERWVRPIRSILSLFDGYVIPFSYSGVKAGKLTYGHRFLAPDSFTVNNCDDYIAGLRDRKVMLDHEERGQFIFDQASKLVQKSGYLLKEDMDLIAEVAGLVEWPSIFCGNIDEKFLTLPDEVLITAMRVHQKYLLCTNHDGSLAPQFIIVSNTVPNDGGKKIVAGNQRVLSARLADAEFFWEQDQKSSLFSKTPSLNKRIFHNDLGTVFDKVARMKSLSANIAQYIPGVNLNLINRAAELSKSDLSTGMVNEFPELQGIMGKYYALNDGEKEEVANAIGEHYAPLGPFDNCPTNPISICLALSDKIDSLVGFWSIGEKPTGSKDPFALRRAALGVIRLIIENKLRMPLMKIFGVSSSFYEQNKKISEDLLSFFADRMKTDLRHKGLRHDYIDAVFSIGGEDDLVRLLARVDALSKFLSSDIGKHLLETYRRAAHILRIEEKKEKCSFHTVTDEFLLMKEEKDLLDHINKVNKIVQEALKREEFFEALTNLTKLHDPIELFFQEVTVIVDNKELRQNRLGLLQKMISVKSKVADFSKISGED